MVITRSAYQQIFDQEFTRLAQIEPEIFNLVSSIEYYTVYRPTFTSIMEEQFMQNVSKELTKSLTKFSGAREEDVVKWLQEIDEAYDCVKLQPSNRFTAIRSYLTGAALDWFRSNKSTIVDWSTFKSAIVEHYQPPFSELLARMERRHQLVDESVTNYYHAKMTLCLQVDPEMSASMLIHYLSKGLNPSLILHVTRRHPTTSTEFLLIARDEEKTRQTVSGLSRHVPIEHDYLVDDSPSDPLVTVVQSPPIRSISSHVRPRFQSPPQPLMDLPSPSFHSPIPRYQYRPLRPSSSSRQCYQCHRLGHIAAYCPNRKNV
jgi:Retrotransposon gag protein